MRRRGWRLEAWRGTARQRTLLPTASTPPPAPDDAMGGTPTAALGRMSACSCGSVGDAWWMAASGGGACQAAASTAGCCGACQAASTAGCCGAPPAAATASAESMLSCSSSRPLPLLLLSPPLVVSSRLPPSRGLLVPAPAVDRVAELRRVRGGCTTPCASRLRRLALCVSSAARLQGGSRGRLVRARTGGAGDHGKTSPALLCSLLRRGVCVGAQAVRAGPSQPGRQGPADLRYERRLPSPGPFLIIKLSDRLEAAALQGGGGVAQRGWVGEWQAAAAGA